MFSGERLTHPLPYLLSFAPNRHERQEETVFGCPRAPCHVRHSVLRPLDTIRVAPYLDRRGNSPEEVEVSEMVEYRNLIGGHMKGAASGRLLDTVNPANAEVWAKVPLSDRADADEAVGAAKAAFPAWSALSPDERSAYLKKVGNLFTKHADELARLESTDNGNPLSISKMVFDEMKVLWDRKAHETLEASTGRTVPLGATTLGLTIREPYGVIAAIVPFNMPVAMLSNKVASALAAGNTVVVKPPEQASVACSALR